MKPEAKEKAGSGEGWDAVSWEGVERAQLKTMLAATPAQRLAWLEEAMRLAHASGALDAARRERAPKDWEQGSRRRETGRTEAAGPKEGD